MSESHPPPTPRIRKEKAILKPEAPLLYAGSGGRLTLTGGKLIWERSRWAVAAYYFSKGLRGNAAEAPIKRTEIDLSSPCEFQIGGRKVAWMGALVPLLLLVDFLSGGMRRTLKVSAPVASVPGTYYFAVKDADSWLADIEKARATED